MLFSLYGARGVNIGAKDGLIGSLHDFYFDDATWEIRYAVVDTGSWLFGRRVLLASAALEGLDASRGELAANVTRDQVKQSPSADSDRPVSRQDETTLHDYYGWTPYWGVGGTGAGVLIPPIGGVPPRPHSTRGGNVAAAEIEARTRAESDPHLRSAREATGYHIRASDGDIGHVEDFLAQDGPWAIRYMVVDTRNWWPGRKVLVSPRWIESIDWPGSSFRVDLDREGIRSGPEYDPSRAVARGYEQRLSAYYRRAPYW